MWTRASYLDRFLTPYVCPRYIYIITRRSGILSDEEEEDGTPLRMDGWKENITETQAHHLQHDSGFIEKSIV